ncbi:hypothetical protein Tco_1294414 [Tanacetum coccineum]
MIRENHRDKENDIRPNVVLSTPLEDFSRRKPGRPAKTHILESPYEDISKRKPGPQKIPLIIIYTHNRPRGRPRLPDISTGYKHKCATAIHADAVVRSVKETLPVKNSFAGTPFQDVTPVGSLAFNSTIVNGTNIGNTVGETSTKDYIDYGDPTFECSSCGALLWYTESMRGATNACSESYSMCCGRGKVELTNEVPEPPPLLKELITNQHPKSANFIDNIRRYNSMFAFTSMGGKQDTSVNTGRSPYCYRLHGENYHLAGPLLPETGKPTKFAQLYIFDTENEIQNRISTVSYAESSSSKNDQLDYKLTTDIRDLLDEINSLVKDLATGSGERIRRGGRQYNLPTASEVASLIVGDFDSTEHKRDVILQCQDGDFKRISELHPPYCAYIPFVLSITGEDNYSY